MERFLNGKILALLVASIIIVMFAFLRLSKGRLVTDLDGRSKVEFPSFKLSQSFKNDQKKKSYAEIMLVDSIVSILQNYYVDLDRTRNISLITSTLRFLRDKNLISYEKKDDGYYLYSNSFTYSFLEAEVNDYNKLLEILLMVATIVEQNQENKPRYNELLREFGFQDFLRGEQSGELVVLSTIIQQLDAHSSLLSSDVYRELKQGTEGRFGGLGVLVGVRDDQLTIIKPIDDSPAQRSGILGGDKIVAIDGRDTFSHNLEELVQFMRGAPETKVKLTLLRDGALAAQDVVLKREIVNVNSVVSKKLSYQQELYSYIKIESFSQTTAEEVKNILSNSEKKGSSAPGLIIDLRQNPGGLLDQAIQVSDLFLDSGVIVSTKGRREEIEYAKDRYNKDNFPIVVLIDSESASASEIVAGALQDHDRAVILGVPSFGKGTVQTIFELPEERALKLTISRYYTPKGTSIQNEGIIPDIYFQPVYRYDDNKNLLGSYRYRGEKYLLNHLSSPDKRQMPIEPYLKSYYLFDGQGKSENDQIVQVALHYLNEARKYQQKNMSKLGEYVFRAKHTLLAIEPSISKYLKEKEKLVISFLKSNHSINWSKKDAQGIHNSSKFEIKLNAISDTSKLIYKKNTEYMFKILVKNLSSNPIERMSAYLKGEHSAVDTFELLVGKINPDEKRLIEIPFYIPNEVKPKKIWLEYGVAIDGMLQSISQSRVKVELEEKENQKISGVKAHIYSESGKKNKVLEPFEKAVVRIEVQNSNQLPLRDVHVEVNNLSGQQIKINSGTSKIPLIDGNSFGTIDLEVQGSDLIVDDHIDVGLVFRSDRFSEPIKKRLEFPSHPNFLEDEIPFYREY